METRHRYIILFITSVTCSLALTLVTYFYSCAGYLPFAAWSVNRGWPFSWAIEMHAASPVVYPISFQALNFSLDLVFWTTILLLPSCLFLYIKGSQSVGVVTSRAWDGVVTMTPSSVQQGFKSSKRTHNQVTLYVKTSRIMGADREFVRQKTIVTQGGVMTDPYPFASKFPYYDVERVTHFDFALPKDQQKMIEDLKELSLKYNFKVEVVDLGKMNVLSRSRFKRSMKIATLPAIVTDSGEIFQGVMTKEQLETCLFQAVKET